MTAKIVTRRASGISLGHIDFTLASSPVWTKSLITDSRAILTIDTLRLRVGWFANIEVSKVGTNTLTSSIALVKQVLPYEEGWFQRSSS